VTADEVSELNIQELISQIALKPMESTNLAAAEEIFAFVSGPSQQYVPSRCIRGQEIEVSPAVLATQNHGNHTIGLKISEKIKANLESSSMGRNYPSHLQPGKSDCLMLQESLETASVSFSSSDYCTLCDNDTTEGLIPAELLKLSDGNVLVKCQNDQNDLP